MTKQKTIAPYAETIPLAVWEEGPIYWDVRHPGEIPASFAPAKRDRGDEDTTMDHGTPHLAALGDGPDMARLRRDVIKHVLKHSESWEIVACDPLGTGEFGYLEEEPTATVATGLEEILDTLRETNAEINRRFGALQESGEMLLRKLKDSPRRILVVVSDLDALSMFSEDLNGREFDGQKAEAMKALQSIALVGAVPGVHLFLSTATVSSIGGQLMYHLRPRLVLDGADEEEAKVLLELPRIAPVTPVAQKGQIAFQTRYVRGAKEMYYVVGYMP